MWAVAGAVEQEHGGLRARAPAQAGAVGLGWNLGCCTGRPRSRRLEASLQGLRLEVGQWGWWHELEIWIVGGGKSHILVAKPVRVMAGGDGTATIQIPASKSWEDAVGRFVVSNPTRKQQAWTSQKLHGGSYPGRQRTLGAIWRVPGRVELGSRTRDEEQGQNLSDGMA